MDVMNDNEKYTGSVEDHLSKLRWSANKKMDAVLGCCVASRSISSPVSSRSRPTGSLPGAMSSSTLEQSSTNRRFSEHWPPEPEA